jgi:hypothetical protein
MIKRVKKLFIALLAGLSAMLIFAGCATGTRVVTGDQHQPVPVEAVKLYQAPPAQYEIIGMVNASARGSRQHRMDVATRKLKQEAAMMGANGIILNPVESGDMADRKIKLSGQAIYVQP